MEEFNEQIEIRISLLFSLIEKDICSYCIEHHLLIKRYNYSKSIDYAIHLIS